MFVKARNASTNLRQFLSRFGRTIKLVWGSAPGWTSAAVLIVGLEGVIPIAAVYLTKLIVDSVALAIKEPNRIDAWERIFPLVVAACALAIMRLLCATLGSVTRQAESDLVRDRMFGLMHEKCCTTDLACFENSEYHDKLYLTQEEVSYRPVHILESILEVGRSSIALLAVTGLIVYLNWVIAVVLMVSCFPLAWAQSRYGHKLHQWYLKSTEQERLAHYLHWMLSVGLYAKEVRSYLLGKLFAERFDHLRRSLRQEKLCIIKSRGLAEFVGSVIPTGVFYGGYSFIIYETIVGRLTLGDMVMYYQAFQLTQEHFQTIMKYLAKLYEDDLFLKSFYELMDLQSSVVEASNALSFPEPVRKGLVFHSVSFSYPGAEVKALSDLSLVLRPGKLVAILGENGSGKTTLVKLLCRFYDPNEGTITIDGIPIDRFSYEDLRREISVVFQDPCRYPFTARENIGFWNSAFRGSDGSIRRAAALSGVHSVIEGLPKGYETVLSRWFPDGMELSSGEWQKVVLARFFHKKSQILVLDEPTTFLDARSEERFFSELRKLTPHRIVILITHNIRSVNMVDYVYVIDRGCVADEGTPDALTRSRGKYRSLFGVSAKK